MTTSEAGPEADGFTVRLPFRLESARDARRMLDMVLAELGASDSIRQDAALVMHELVVNGVNHGQPDGDHQLEVTCSVGDGQVLIGVRDRGNAGTVRLQSPDEATPSGRGLAIVDALSAQWSVDRSDGTRVSAVLLVG